MAKLIIYCYIAVILTGLTSGHFFLVDGNRLDIDDAIRSINVDSVFKKQPSSNDRVIATLPDYFLVNDEFYPSSIRTDPWILQLLQQLSTSKRGMIKKHKNRDILRGLAVKRDANLSPSPNSAISTPNIYGQNEKYLNK